MARPRNHSVNRRVARWAGPSPPTDWCPTSVTNRVSKIANGLVDVGPNDVKFPQSNR